jgi:predicted nucleic acid-binding protein
MASSFVVDNSVVISWCFEDEEDAYAEAVMDSFAKGNAEAVVPSIWPLEASNVLLVAERRKRLTTNQVSAIIRQLSRLPICVEPESMSSVFENIISLAKKHLLSCYDAAYLNLAIRLNLPLATLDTALLKAAKKCGIAVYRPA